MPLANGILPCLQFLFTVQVVTGGSGGPLVNVAFLVGALGNEGFLVGALGNDVSLVGALRLVLGSIMGTDLSVKEDDLITAAFLGEGLGASLADGLGVAEGIFDV